MRSAMSEKKRFARRFTLWFRLFWLAAAADAAYILHSVRLLVQDPAAALHAGLGTGAVAAMTESVAAGAAMLVLCAVAAESLLREADGRAPR